jgi:hypothetical protein
LGSRSRSASAEFCPFVRLDRQCAPGRVDARHHAARERYTRAAQIIGNGAEGEEPVGGELVQAQPFHENVRGIDERDRDFVSADFTFDPARQPGGGEQAGSGRHGEAASAGRPTAHPT